MFNVTNGTNTTTVSYFQWISEDVRIFFDLIYIIIICAGVTGNVLVILAVTQVPSMKTVTNIFICNLACADLIVTTICCPLVLTHMLTYPNWTLGENMCYFINFCIHLSLSGSSFALLAISLDRYLAIAHAQKQWMTFQKVNVLIVITWLLSTTLSVPSVLIKADTSSLSRAADVCLQVWRGSAKTKQFETIKGLVFVLVFSMIAFFYYRIARVLWKRKIPGNQTSENQEAAQRARKKVVKLLLIVLFCFLGCWAPFMLYRLLKMILSDRGINPPEAVYTGTTVLAMTNSAMNPILYALFNRNFRFAFKNIYRKFLNNQVLPLPEAFSVAGTEEEVTRRRRYRLTLSSLVPKKMSRISPSS
jgi:hypothetical protein